MPKTINGLPYNEVFEKLSLPLPKEAILTRDYDNIVYIEEDTIRNRLDEVIGNWNYSEEYEVTKVVAKSTHSFVAKCKLTIFNDDGEVAFVKEYYGGNDIIFANIDKTDEYGNPVIKLDRNGNPVFRKDSSGNVTEKPEYVKIKSEYSDNVGNTASAACTDAFKKLCRKFFRIGKEQLEAAKNGTSYEAKITRVTQSNGNYFGDFSSSEGNFKFVIFKSQAGKIPDVVKLKVNDKCTITGDMGEDKYNNPQLVVKNLKITNQTQAAPAKTTQTSPKVSSYEATIIQKPARLQNNQGLIVNATVKDKPCQLVFIGTSIENFANKGIKLEEISQITTLTVTGYEQVTDKNVVQIVVSE